MRTFVAFLFLSLMAFGPGMGAEPSENPFMSVRDSYQWAIEQVMAHKPLEAVGDNGAGTGQTIKAVKTKAKKQVENPPEYKTQVYQFQTETDKAKVGVDLTDTGNAFIVDVTSDQVIEGWLIKRQSTREVFLKGTGSPDNPYKCRIRVDRPYLRDFGLTVYVTKDSDPAFIQLF